MTSSFEYSVPLQLFQHDLVDLLTLPARVRLHASHWAHAKASAEEGITSDAAETSQALVDGLITGEYLRGLVQHAPVRIRIPPKKQEALLHRNPYVQEAITRFREEKAAASSSGEVAASPKEVNEQVSHHFSHRVGRLDTLLLKPSIANEVEEILSGGRTDEVLVGKVNALRVAPQSWLVAVDLGTHCETFPISAVSNEPFTAEEHKIWIRTSIGSTVTSTIPASPTSSHFLTGEGGKELQQQLTTVRAVLKFFSALNSSVALPPSITDALQPSKEGMDQRKHARDETEDEDIAAQRQRSVAVQVRRLEGLLAQQEAQMNQFRALVGKKDSEIRDLLQQLKEQESQHLAATTTLEEKLKDLGKGHRQLMQKAEAKEKQLEVSADKLRRIAQLCQKYKGVFTEAVRLLQAVPKLGKSTPSEWKIEEVQEQLQKANGLTFPS